MALGNSKVSLVPFLCSLTTLIVPSILCLNGLDEREKGFSLGAKDHLIKPYNPTKLSKVIMQTLISNGKKGQILIPQKEGEQDQL
ncbi:hypothetical protein D0469_14420 [Peribacillus saganii]|uniref:Response regulatory domain-containing protein n=1 Tax=Peribacillus saganii TaxID=2303992 RepID=A0A372LLF0_9BACI|nr:hypothetical protein [Peribacillus saganii]RFU67450.1 hypothetical protein D0469_14420 [Peribacillus saganii]